MKDKILKRLITTREIILIDLMLIRMKKIRVRKYCPGCFEDQKFRRLGALSAKERHLDTILAYCK